MKISVPLVNLIFAWIWVLGGFLTGMIMGLKFQDENWLGGYSSEKRRLYRLGHISFFGLAAINLMFYFTVRAIPESGHFLRAASGALMPIINARLTNLCCRLTYIEQVSGNQFASNRSNWYFFRRFSDCVGQGTSDSPSTRCT
jgi:hypothetical protein